MIIKELPDPALANNSNRPALQSQVICASTKTKYQYPNHTTPYLLIANFTDTGNYRLNKRHIGINDRLFYFLNAGDMLEINFKDQKPLETLLILFSDELIKGAIAYMQTGIDGLLANGGAVNGGDWNIPNIPFEYNPEIFSLLKSIKTCSDPEDLDSTLFDLLESFWPLKNKAGDNLNRIHAKRKSTREELYRRLLVAKIFIQDKFKEPITIEDIASEACLDKFHALKLFKSFFGVTPHQYLVKLKLEHAYRLLAAGRCTVMEACNQVGFESQGSFTNLFKKYYHLLPSDVSKARKYRP